MDWILKLLNSRKLAVYMLVLILLLLIFSSFLPSEITLPREQWVRIERERPAIFWFATHFSTPYIVRNPVFLIVSAFLFLSTLTCTTSRIKRWVQVRKSEFEIEKAFSFTLQEELRKPEHELRERLVAVLHRKRWTVSTQERRDVSVINGLKGGGTGFWGSVLFHVGLVICFLAIPVTALSVFRGQFIVTEGVTMPWKEGLISHEGRPLSSLPDFDITVKELSGTYAQGIYKVDFGGIIRARGQDLPFAINNPVTIDGYQFTLHEFGNAPGLVIQKGDAMLFDYFLNLRHSREGDYFPFESEELTLFALFFPDFFREGTKIGTRTKEPRNPVIMIKLLKGEAEIGKGLLPLGEEVRIGEYKVTFSELRNWANFVVVKEMGVSVLGIGMVVGLIGLFVRFLSNERRLEVMLHGVSGGVSATIKGYSRYYPAFLEKEVREMAVHIRGGEQ